MPYICFFLALLILLATVALCVVRIKKHSGAKLSITNLLCVGVFLASTALFIPIYNLQFSDDWSHWLKTLLISAHNTIRLFVLDGEFNIIIDYSETLAPALAPLFSAVAAVLYIVAPILTFSFVISLFRNIGAYRSLLFHHRSTLYVFSEINDRSLVLASSLKKKKPNALTIFHDVIDDGSELHSELFGRAKEIGAVCFPGDITANHYSKHGKHAPIFFFVMGDDDNENQFHALRLRTEFENRKNTHLYIFSDSIEAELLFSSSAAGTDLVIRRINPVRTLIDRTLYDRGFALFQNAIDPDGRGKEKEINAVVLGLGKYGSEMVKSLAWFCQMDGYSLRVDAFDIRTDAESVFSAQCPELMDACHNGVNIPGDAKYRIAIHSGVNIHSTEFSQVFWGLPQTTYVFVALGSDSENIKESVYVRSLSGQRRIAPQIQAVLYSSDKKLALSSLTNFKGQPYDIEFIGDIDESYDEDTILNSKLEFEALKRHLGWGKEEDFWGFEFNYRSSVAAAIHHKMRILCRIPGADQPAGLLPGNIRSALECLEHRRWSAYMRSIGYRYSGSPDRASRDDMAKLHNDLIPYGQLVPEEQRKDSNVGLV